MVKVRSGSIINIASISAETGNSGPAGAHYSASKAGLMNLTKSAARELSPYNIQVNAIAPGVIDTPMRKLSSKETNEGLLKNIPHGRFGSVEEMGPRRNLLGFRFLVVYYRVCARYQRGMVY